MPEVDNKASQKFFDQLALEYDTKRNKGFLSAAEEAIGFYLHKFPSAKRNALLEIGVGTGEMFAAFAKTYKTAVALDIAETMVTVAKSKSANGSLFCVASAEAIPFEDSSFDTILCMDVLEHVNSPATVMAEIGRVLSPSGSALVTTPNPLWAPIQWTAEKLHMKVPEGPHRYVFLPALAKDLARGRDNITVQHIGYLVYAPYGPFKRPAVGQWLSEKPVLRRLGQNQLAVLGRRA